MGLSIEVQKKSKLQEKRQICKSSEVFNLKEVQEIKDAIQEHLLFIGLDSKNNVSSLSLILRCSSKVILFSASNCLQIKCWKLFEPHKIVFL